MTQKDITSIQTGYNRLQNSDSILVKVYVYSHTKKSGRRYTESVYLFSGETMGNFYSFYAFQDFLIFLNYKHALLLYSEAVKVI